MFSYQEWLFQKTKKSLQVEESREMILRDSFLSFVYKSHLDRLLISINLNEVGSSDLKVIEIGAAGSVTKLLKPEVVTLDVREDENVDLVISSEDLPFDDSTVFGVIGKDVFHHIANPEKHLSEVRRILVSGGKCAYIEPNWNIFSRFFYTLAHPEPWKATQLEWDFITKDPMYSNQALPWIVFVRDYKKFETKYPDLRLEVHDMPLLGLSYLLSGGLNRRNRISGKLLSSLYTIEQRHLRYMRIFGLARLIVLTKLPNT